MKNASDQNTPETNQNDPAGYTAGIRLKAHGATIAGSYSRTVNERGVLTDASSEVVSVGANYKWGANGVSIAWNSGEVVGVNEQAGEDETEFVNIAYSRTLGPGVAWRTNLMFADFEGEDTTVTTDDADSWALVTGIKIGF
jgi:hypothetical protein